MLLRKAFKGFMLGEQVLAFNEGQGFFQTESFRSIFNAFLLNKPEESFPLLSVAEVPIHWEQERNKKYIRQFWAIYLSFKSDNTINDY